MLVKVPIATSQPAQKPLTCASLQQDAQPLRSEGSWILPYNWCFPANHGEGGGHPARCPYASFGGRSLSSLVRCVSHREERSPSLLLHT